MLWLMLRAKKENRCPGFSDEREVYTAEVQWAIRINYAHSWEDTVEFSVYTNLQKSTLHTHQGYVLDGVGTADQPLINSSYPSK